jgi:hypothetical protein
MQVSTLTSALQPNPTPVQSLDIFAIKSYHHGSKTQHRQPTTGYQVDDRRYAQRRQMCQPSIPERAPFCSQMTDEDVCRSQKECRMYFRRNINAQRQRCLIHSVGLYSLFDLVGHARGAFHTCSVAFGWSDCARRFSGFEAGCRYV